MTRSPASTRMRFFFRRPDEYAQTSKPFSRITRKRLSGSTSDTLPPNSTSSSFAKGAPCCSRAACARAWGGGQPLTADRGEWAVRPDCGLTAACRGLLLAQPGCGMFACAAGSLPGAGFGAVGVVAHGHVGHDAFGAIAVFRNHVGREPDAGFLLDRIDGNGIRAVLDRVDSIQCVTCSWARPWAARGIGMPMRRVARWRPSAVAVCQDLARATARALHLA
ncbi:hypothetical protein CBM2634_B160417 [Cupriavidus taiwanensis]|uniref:Uncharacterized protein n=1 Tax=Cupriavidus taiwanensis TaxID=164546 RepID=A0A375J7I5_9BURK|nr:hypothetical protein CBM2634_B160417 [Cupriavidus taiwanensis]